MRRYRHVITVNRQYYTWDAILPLFRMWKWITNDPIKYVSEQWFNDI